MNCIDFFFEQSGSSDKNFVVGKQEISFTQLKEESCKLATYIKNNVGTDKCILLLSANNIFFITVYLAIMKSGNVCIPLDPRLEPENLDFIRKQSNPELAFLTPDVNKRIKIGWCEKITSDEYLSLLEKEPPMPVDESFDKEQTAQIIFTSGSTGIPKGVMLSHKNIIANTDSIVEYLDLTQEDRMLVVMPFFYCYGLSLLHTHLRVGGSIVLNNSFIFLGAVINDLKNQNCTGFAGVPSHFQILLRKSETFVNTEFPGLRYVTQAGGKLTPVFIDEFKASFPNTDFVVMYGQTEATARLSYLPPELYEQKKGSLGKGIPGVQLRVVNETGDSVQPGEVGEIIAFGDNIMKGYIKDPEETANTIRNGWLYTGDLATVDEEGFIYHSARKKEIMKVGGKRISPKEIEEVILRLPEVVDCSIESIQDDILGEAIKANVVLNTRTGAELTSESIKEHCANHLALYKLPHVVEFKDKMELSSSGKKIKTKL